MSYDVAIPIGPGPGRTNEQFAMGPQYAIQARRNHSQSLERLAARGGLDWSEAAAIIEGRQWARMDEAEAQRIVRAVLKVAEGSGGC